MSKEDGVLYLATGVLLGGVGLQWGWPAATFTAGVLLVVLGLFWVRGRHVELRTRRR